MKSLYKTVLPLVLLLSLCSGQIVTATEAVSGAKADNAVTAQSAGKGAAHAAKKLPPAPKEDEAVAALTKMGVPLQKDPAGVVRWIEASAAEMTDEAMAYLPALRHLEWLEVGRGSVTAAGTAKLQGCTGLKRLYLHDINLAGDEFKWLEALTQLESLSLQRTGASGVVMQHIKAPNLVVLNLSGNKKIKDDVLIAAARIKGLEVLSLADTDITGAGLESLRGMTRLNELNLVNCFIYDRDIAVFLSMPNLRIVYAEGCPLNNYAIQNIIMKFPTLAIFN